MSRRLAEQMRDEAETLGTPLSALFLTTRVEAAMAEVVNRHAARLRKRARSA